MKMRKKTKRLLLIFIALGVISLGVGVAYTFLNRPSEDTEKEEPGKKEEEKPVKKLKIMNPESNSRPYAVMINNNSAVWKYQSGMNEAYIVYEMLVEGGITREMALFKDTNTAKIQSIRSSRHYFLDYALENDALYIHWGQSPQAQSDIASLKINNLNGLYYENTYFFRDKTIPKDVGMEHKGYATMESIKKGVKKLGYRTTTENDNLLSYSIDSLDLTKYEGVKDAKYIEVPYSGGYKAKFFYDEATKLYKRSQNNTELIDYNSKERVTTKNIIVYNVKYRTLDSKGRQDMENIGSGTGYFITEGKAVPITWEKSSRSGRTVYKYKDGSKLVVNDGTTYIGIEPTGRNIKIDANLPSA